jgi:catechol 2,3-dioxygenase-like lactoylglutathione lyase family enzyme
MSSSITGTLSRVNEQTVGEFFHVGVIVEDLEAAMAEFAATLGLEFNEPHESTYGDSHIHVCYSLQGPPSVELIQGEPGSMWSTSDGSRADHVGYFVDDLEATRARLEDAGMPVDIDGMAFGGRFTYHRMRHTGMRIELIDAARREPLLASIRRR